MYTAVDPHPDAPGNDRAAPGQVWVCGACGKRARTRYGVDDGGATNADPGWDESCMMHAVLCWEAATPP